jgi:hypothetical protein
MKCACGYAFEKDEKYNEVVVKGDEPFYRLYTNGAFWIDTYALLGKDVDLFICPKCGTVRAEIKQE